MKRIWHRFLTSLTPGTRVLLCVLSVVYLSAAVGKYSQTYDLCRWLGMSGPGFWHGQVWGLITYPLLPSSVLDFVFNCLMIVMLGGWLERIWSRAGFWAYCVVAAAGTGLTKVVLQPSNPIPMNGATPVVFGLLVAWGFLLGHQKVPMGFLGEISVRRLALLVGVISFVTMVFSAGLVSAVIMVAGGLTGWLYLWLRSKMLMSRESRVV